MRIGSLCSGYGGLDAGVQSVLGGRTVWVSDIDKGANKILAHRYPDAPNLGDLTTTDWATVEPIDVLTAGFPCQPVSHAGKRLGDEDERWLWDDVARAVGELRPGLVVLENVRGLLTAGAGRLFGRVLGTLADFGYDAQWHCLRAADVGAPHGRFRIFIVAHPRDRAEHWERARPQSRQGSAAAPDADHLGHQRGRRARDGRAGSADRSLIPTPLNADAGPRGGTTGFGLRDWSRAHALLPTPMVGSTSPAAHGQISGQWREQMAYALNRWGDYGDAIARWEGITRPAPPPTEPSKRGTPRLSPAFSEWLMGLPAGWVTDVPGITRNEALRALGNGVVPQQCAAALRLMLGHGASEMAPAVPNCKSEADPAWEESAVFTGPPGSRSSGPRRRPSDSSSAPTSRCTRRTDETLRS